ncbi:hypothetical protein [Shewanella baltica]|uniref:hypothetical protein n=1 Tax=Shewanella baltica TaxID=62322 RepID=UPI003D78FD56
MLDVKSAVLICPAFFDYKNLIEKQLQKRFSSVYSFSDRPLCSSIAKALIKYNVANYNDFVSRRYSNDIFEEIKSILKDVSTIIIIKGTCISFSFINMVKAVNPDVKVFVYNWDSISNVKGFISLAEKADKAMSFDFSDCQDFNLQYLPLFYPDNYVQPNVTIANCKKKYRYSFIGSYHGDRAELLVKLLTKERHLSNYSFVRIYFQSKIQFAVFFLKDPFLRRCPREWISFDIIHRDMMNDILADTDYIIDIHHQGQSGLTMRTWETLSLDYNLLTTNPFVLLHQPIASIEILNRPDASIWSNTDKQKFVEQVASNSIVTTSSFSLSSWLDELLK